MTTPRAAKHKDMEQRFRDLEHQVRTLVARTVRRPQFEVSEGDLRIKGGALTVDGGDFLLLDTDGSTVFQLGPMINGDRGVVISRETGEPAITSRKVFPTSPAQTLMVLDKAGNAILSEAVFGSGREAPYLPLQVQPVQATSGPLAVGPYGPEVTVAADTFTNTHRATFLRENPFARWLFAIKASDATTAGEVQVVNADNGAPLITFLGPAWVGTVPAGVGDYVSVDPGAGLLLPGNYLDRANLAVQVRRTAGTGSLTVAVRMAQGGPA